MELNEIVTPLELRFLHEFFATEAAKHFVLTGGTALAGFYLFHRRSKDLDLFTVQQDILEEASDKAKEIIVGLGGEIVRARRSETFRQFVLQRSDETLQVDLVRDAGPQYGAPSEHNGIRVDSIENIGANKVTAIFGRTESKDFVDLYCIVQAGYSLEHLFQLAKEKDLGLTEFYFVGAMRQVDKLKRLPDMRQPITLEELKAFYHARAREWMSRLDPNHREE